MEKLTMVIIGIIILGVVMVGSVINTNIKMSEYCKEQGWDGFIIEIDLKGSCYRVIPHESGLGENKEYSGRLGLKDKG